ERARAGVGYFKWDGFQFTATEPDLGTPPGIHARRAVLETVRRLAGGVRALDPDMFLNITSGTWLSPWWLAIADQIWMGGEDYGSADVPSISTRDSSITYRDLVLYEDFRTNDLWFPLANLMTHGVLKGSIDVEEIGRDEPLSDFANEVVFYLARGVTMHELYISPDVLSDGEWRVLSEALRWARDRFPLLSRGEMVGGDPKRREAYGWAHFAGPRGIVAARNPDIAPTTMAVTLDPAHGLDPDARDLVLERVYPTRWVDPRLHRAGERVEVPLLGYEAAVYELYPLDDAAEPLLAGATFSEPRREGTNRTLHVLDAGPDVRLLDPSASATVHIAGTPRNDIAALAVPPRPPLATSAGVTAEGRAFVVEATVDTRARNARVAVLLRPEVSSPAGGHPEIACTLDGREVTPATVSVPGVWAWASVPVSAGRHELKLEVVSPDGTAWAGMAQAWLVGAERIRPVEVALVARETMPARRPLPPSGLGPDEMPVSVKLGEAAMRSRR
ncbi:MAG: hypothetical protein ACOY3Y_09530, partial [Acidobacteriota bacterium]